MNSLSETKSYPFSVEMAGCPGFLGMTYLHLFVSALVTTAFAKYPLFDVVKGRWSAVEIVSIVSVFILLFVLSSLNPGPVKYGVFFVFLALLGTITQTLQQKLDKKGLVEEVSITVAGIFLAMTAVGFYDKDNLLGFGPYLFAALIGLILARLVLLFVVVSNEEVSESAKKTNTTLSVVGTLLFSLFVAYDTQMLKQMAKLCRGTPDYIQASMGLYLDILNLFSDVGDILE